MGTCMSAKVGSIDCEPIIPIKKDVFIVPMKSNNIKLHRRIQSVPQNFNVPSIMKQKKHTCNNSLSVLPMIASIKMDRNDRMSFSSTNALKINNKLVQRLIMPDSLSEYCVYNDMLGNFPDGMIVINVNNTIIYANEVFNDIFPEISFLQKDINEIFPNFPINFSTNINFSLSENRADLPMLKINSTLVETLFTFCPPLPPLLDVLNVISLIKSSLTGIILQM